MCAAHACTCGRDGAGGLIDHASSQLSQTQGPDPVNEVRDKLIALLGGPLPGDSSI